MRLQASVEAAQMVTVLGRVQHPSGLARISLQILQTWNSIVVMMTRMETAVSIWPRDLLLLRVGAFTLREAVVWVWRGPVHEAENQPKSFFGNQ